MTWIFLWDSEPSKIFVGDTEVSSVWVWDTKVRPNIINFATQWPCPDGFHVPTKDEFDTLLSIVATLWLGIGYPQYFLLPKTWQRSFDTAYVNDTTRFWQYRTCTRSSSEEAYRLFFSGSSTTCAANYTAYWYQIRPFKNEVVVPDSSWTSLYSDKIYHNSTLWLISYSGDGNTRYTMADKNLWGANAGDTWYYYQRWNNYWFPSSWSITESYDIRVDASSYWPWNYYSSSTFMRIGSSPFTWDTSPYNYNLRWGVDWNVPVT